MRITLQNAKNAARKLLPIVIIAALVIGTFLLTGLLKTFTGSALSALIVVLVLLLAVAPFFSVIFDKEQKF